MQLNLKTVCEAQKRAITFPGHNGFSEVHYYGGLGCGKTFAGGATLLRYISVPNTACCVVRRTIKTLKASTLRGWLKPDSPILHPALIQHHDKATGHIEFINGSYMDCLGTVNIDDVLTREYALIFVDELPQVSEEAYMTLKGRLRQEHPLGQRLMAAYNPCSIYSWVYQYQQSRLEDPAFLAIRGKTKDNGRLPPQYYDQLKRGYTQKQIDRLLEGLFVPDEDLIFFGFSEHNIGEFPAGKRVVDAVVFQDYGGGEGDCALLLAWVFHDGTIYVSDEVVRERLTHSDVHLLMDKLWKQTGMFNRPPQVVYDAANASLGREMRRWGWDTMTCDKHIESGIAAVNEVFAQKRATISPYCKRLINSLQTLTRAQYTAKKKVKGWDAPDALRYGIMWASRDGGAVT